MSKQVEARKNDKHAFPMMKQQDIHKAQVLVISLLLAIMQSCHVLNSTGLSATYIGKNEAEMADIRQGKFQFVFATPEAIVGTKSGEICCQILNAKCIEWPS